MSAPATTEERGGLIAWFVRNHVASNVIMVLLIVGGLATLLSMKVEVFPEIDPGAVRVTVPYPGASPEEVEQGLILVIEEAVRGLDGVGDVSSSAGEGGGSVSVELLEGL